MIQNKNGTGNKKNFVPEMQTSHREKTFPKRITSNERVIENNNTKQMLESSQHVKLIESSSSRDREGLSTIKNNSLKKE